MTFSLGNISLSLADYLAPEFPGVHFYEDPNQQGTQIPCMFLQQRFATIKLRQGGRYFQTIGLDLTYLEDYNLPNLQRLYETAAGTLDGLMELIPYAADGSPPTLLRTYEREWRIDQDALHYKFELRLWLEENSAGQPKMENMIHHEQVVEKDKE